MDYEQLQRLRRLQKEYGLSFVPEDIWEDAVLYSGNHDDDDTLVFWIMNLMAFLQDTQPQHCNIKNIKNC